MSQDKSKRNDRVTNITPYDCDIVLDEGKFTLVFKTKIGGDFTRTHTVKIHLERWWLSIIAKLLWKVVNRDSERLSRDIATLKGEA